EEVSTKFINLIERITYQKWHINITIVIQDFFKLQTIALIDSGAQMNCIKKLIPTKFFEKTKQKLSTDNGDNLSVKFKISDVHICNDCICIKQSFILVKDLDIGIILGQLFLEIIKLFKVKTKGITTKIFQRKILFAFNEKPITKINLLKTLSIFKEHSINLIKAKENHLYFMKQEISNKKLEEQLQALQIRENINLLKNNITKNLCSDIPDVFWHRKRHVVSLPYEKDFSERNIPTKASPIQMTHELIEYCKKEIQELLNKKLIRSSKSPWSCAAFYVNKNLEIEHGTPRLGTITPIQKSILFAEKFPDIILDKKQLQRFLGSLNYIRDLFQTSMIYLPSIVLCIQKFQSDLLNKKFFIIVDCVAANSIITKDLKNLASKQIFARWQGILFSFDFTIEHIKGDLNSLTDYLTREFLQ
ncbi:LOW QUALITY PROTEIN: hypothetical protein CFOL_v3_00097, partial [Cephalotus follicularis]